MQPRELDARDKLIKKLVMMASKENPPVGEPVVLDYPLPDREIVLEHRTRSIRVHLKGDSVVAMDNFGADLTYFDPIDD